MEKYLFADLLGLAVPTGPIHATAGPSRTVATFTYDIQTL